MTRNQKILLGCGGAGCLGLILVVIVCVVLVAAGYVSLPGSSNSNYNSNSNSNYNSNANTNDNLNSNSTSDSSSSMSEDDKHKLFQAAGITKDNALIQRVLIKLGFLTTTGTVSTDYEAFMKAHFAWAQKNVEFIQSINSPGRARAYVDEHIDD